MLCYKGYYKGHMVVSGLGFGFSGLRFRGVCLKV